MSMNDRRVGPATFSGSTPVVMEDIVDFFQREFVQLQDSGLVAECAKHNGPGRFENKIFLITTDEH